MTIHPIRGPRRVLRTRLSRRAALAGLGATALACLTACSPPVSNSSSGSSDTGGGSGGGGAVIILTHDSFTLPEELLAAFEEQSGIALTTVSAGDAGVANQLVLAAGQYDGVYGIDTFTAGVVQEHEVLEAYDSPALPESARQYATAGLTPIDIGDVCLNIDDAWFAENGLAAPTALEQLAEPEYAQLTVLIDPAGSTPGFAFLAGVHTAVADPDAFLSALLGGGAKVAASWSQAYYEDFSIHEGGQFPLALSYASSPAETDGATSVLAASAVRQVEFAGVVAGAQNPAGARAFIDWMLSPEVQAAIPTSMYMYPVDEAAALPETWARHAQLAEHPIEPDVTAVNEQRDAWIDGWNSAAEG